jgi:hypothetical protein
MAAVPAETNQQSMKHTPYPTQKSSRRYAWSFLVNDVISVCAGLWPVLRLALRARPAVIVDSLNENAASLTAQAR